MRLEDIIKHYNEEKKDLSVIKLIFALHVLIFINSPLQAQTFINGFCRVESFSSTAGFNKIFTFDINQDSLKDILVFKPGEKRYAVHRAITSSKFTESTDKNFEYKIDDLNSYSSQANELAFASRDSKTIGIASVSYFGLMQVVFKQELSSFPSRIYAADMNNDGNKKLIAAGNSCAGIHIVNRYNKVKPKVVLFPEKTFESLAIFDFNYDFYNDIVAIDFLENQLVFASNFSNDYFMIERVIPFRERISDLTLIKYNDDPFYDLAFITENSIEILLGDSVYSFTQKVSFPTAQRANSFTIEDYNNDGFSDLAYLIKSMHSVNIVFSKGATEYQRPFEITNDNSLSYIENINDQSVKLISLCTNGNLNSFSLVKAEEKEYSIFAPNGIGNTGSFTTSNFSYFYYVDTDQQNLQIFQHAENQPFKFTYSIPLAKAHEIINPEIILNKNVRFFCYSNNSSLLEIIDYDFKSNTMVKNRIIAEGPMTDYLFERRKKNLVKLLAVDKKDLISSVYEITQQKIKFSYEDTLFNTLGGVYSRNDTRKSYIWKLNDSKLYFELAGLSDGTKSIKKILDLKEFSFDLTKLKMTTVFDNYNEIVISYFGGGDNGKLFYYSANELKEAKIKNISHFALYKNKNHLHVVSNIVLEKEKFYLNNRIFDLDALLNIIDSRNIDKYNFVSINEKKFFCYNSFNSKKITFIGVK